MCHTEVGLAAVRHGLAVDGWAANLILLRSGRHQGVETRD